MLKSHELPIFEEKGEATLDFVGDFEAKYEAEVDPWEQSGRTGVRADYYAYSRKKLVTRLASRLTAEARGLEVGCGYGYLSSMLATKFPDMTGMDVSDTALRRAEKLNPGVTYVRGDITADGFAPPEKYHFLVLAQCWWYILHEVELTISNCMQCLVPGGIFVLSQAFLKKQRYGLKIANGFEGALRLLMATPGLRLIECSYDDTGLLCYYDGLIVMRKLPAGVEP